jgi:transcription termination factor Rho
MSAEQLERSILERKASDELRAIAAAMSLEPPARTKKADLVNQILRAAGVEVEGQSANGHAQIPGGGTDAKTGTPPSGAPAVAGSGGSDSSAIGIGASTNGTVAAAKRSPRSRGGKNAKSTAESGPSGVADASSAAAGPISTAEASDTSDSPAGSRGAADSGDSDSESSSPEERHGYHPAPASDTGNENTAAAHGSGPAGAAKADLPGVSAEPGNGASASDEAGGGAQGAEAGPNGSQPQRSGSPNAAQNRPPRDRQQFQGGSGNQQAEAGNRRSRRRRGRDRGERELQTPQAEATYQGELVPVKGLLDLREEGYGFLRTGGYLPSQKDVYVSISQARRFGLRRGDAIEGACRPAGPSEKYPALLRIDTICGMAPEEAARRRRFEDLTPLFPDERLRLEMGDDSGNLTARIVDLISPIGKGQRGLIVSPPKAGKTTVLKQIAHSIEANNPDVHLMVLLVEERPEEVTDMRRSVRGEVIASTFDRPSEEHTAVSELAIERAKRLVELGKDVVIILDGITRLARAYNLAQPATGRIMSGGVDSGALYPPRKFFGAARNIEEGGSLTILATALVETGSKMDEVIFEEFKGTGNMELRLDRKLAERRIYPAIDVNASSTRREELLFDRNQLQQVWKLRRVLNALSQDGNTGAGLELLMDKIKTTRSNDEFLLEIAKAPV